MKTNQTNGIVWRKWLATAWSRFADACAFSAATQGGWVPSEPVMREVVARTLGRERPVESHAGGTTEGEADGAVLTCCACCAG